MEDLLHRFYDRKVVRDYCDKICCVLPIIFCIGDKERTKEYAESKARADKLYEKIMADPEKIKKTVDVYLVALNDDWESMQFRD